MTEQLREDIRHLGRILGEVIEEQEGSETYDLVEQCRKLAFDLDRGTHDFSGFVELFRNIEPAKTIPIIRAFSHFALLANLAEDLNDEAELEARLDAGEPPHRGAHSSLRYC